MFQHIEALLQQVEIVATSPLCLPRYFFQVLQSTTVKVSSVTWTSALEANSCCCRSPSRPSLAWSGRSPCRPTRRWFCVWRECANTRGARDSSGPSPASSWLSAPPCSPRERQRPARSVHFHLFISPKHSVHLGTVQTLPVLCL